MNFSVVTAVCSVFLLERGVFHYMAMQEVGVHRKNRCFSKALQKILKKKEMDRILQLSLPQ
jgi:hypothetical protein